MQPVEHSVMEPSIGSEYVSFAHSLMALPTELHLQISSYLPYPDALALKHTCRHFYYLVYTGVHLKVDWLVERFERKLECPMEKCSFRTDESFCNWRIRRIMERRRRHLECPRRRGGCFVIEGRTCQKDLVPIWLKRQGRVKLFKHVGKEGLWAVPCPSADPWFDLPLCQPVMESCEVNSQTWCSHVKRLLTATGGFVDRTRRAASLMAKTAVTAQLIVEVV
ncbi:F-box domain protein [Aspergillus udagawae]|uniref:F-box domain protein n=1 Tax=Aspergillus udagawae TaxID=91492 RepID=A0A8H3N337_9EURO|nr:F-box domain protein [Aspergillus udagawae]